TPNAAPLRARPKGTERQSARYQTQRTQGTHSRWRRPSFASNSSRGGPITTIASRIGDRFAFHAAQPSPEAHCRHEVLDRERSGYRHDLPGRIRHELRKPDDESLGRDHAQAFRGVPVGHILEKGLRVDRLATLPIEDGQDPFDSSIEIERARIAT